MKRGVKSTDADGGMKTKISITLLFLMFLCVVFLLGVQKACAECFGAPLPGGFAGEYIGTYVGDDYGTFVITISSQGTIEGYLTIQKGPKTLPMNGSCSYGGDCEFHSYKEEISFSGKIDFSCKIKGTWSQKEPSTKGIFIAAKIKPQHP